MELLLGVRCTYAHIRLPPTDRLEQKALPSLRDYNHRTRADAGFYGLDVYSLWESLRRVVSCLSKARPEAVGSVVEAIRCFEPYEEDPQRYAWATRMVPEDCEEEVIGVLSEVRRTPRLSDSDPEADFDARQNAEVLAGG